LKRAQGFAIFTVARLGFLVSARAGSGIVIARLQDDTWSAPSALGLGGLGGGFNVGAEVTDFLIILNSKAAVRSFMATGSLQLGGNLSVAVGPLGRAAEASGAINSSGNLAAMYSYSKSKGLYGGVSVEGTVLVDRSDANAKAYHRSITAKQILSGNIEAPSFAQPLINLIEKFTLSGDIAAGIEEGKRSLDHWNNDEDDRDVDSLDRQMQSARLSPASASRRNNKDFIDDYDSQRPGNYAFGGGTGGGSGSYQTNSPSRIKKSFLGNSYMSSKGTDYGDGNDSYDPSPPRGSSSTAKGRPMFSRNKSSTASGSIFGDEAAVLTPSIERGSLYESSNGSGIRARQSRTASFPTQFGKADDDTTDEEDAVKSIPRDVNGFAVAGPRDSYEEAEDLRRKPHSALTRSGTNDLLDFELDRSAVTQRQAPQSREKDLIDFTADSSSRSYGTRRTGSGMDELDRELLARGDSLSSVDSLSHRRNGSGPTPAWAETSSNSRPKMQGRTSSTQKIFNRLRGNSQSSKNAFANIETWESPSSRRSHSPSPDLMGSSTPPAFKSSTPTGFRGATPPTSFKSTTPTPGFRSSSTSTPTGYKRSTPSPAPAQVLDYSAYQESLKVIATYDFEGQEEDDLSFRRGDVIDVVKRTANRDDWWIGKRGSKLGNFPANRTVDV
jgi:lipid-binding SYLF domain-containing protein